MYSWNDAGRWSAQDLQVVAGSRILGIEVQNVEQSLLGRWAVAAFLEQYQLSRGREFSVDELEVAWAAGLLPSLHNARNEVLEGNRPLVLERLIDDCEDRLHLANA